MNDLYNWIIKTFFIKDIDAVLGQMHKTLADLDVVRSQQLVIANDLNNVIAEAQAARDNADENQARSIRVADKLAELLK